MGRKGDEIYRRGNKSHLAKWKIANETTNRAAKPESEANDPLENDKINKDLQILQLTVLTETLCVWIGT